MALTKQISRRSIILSPTTAEVSTAQTIAPYYDFRIDGTLSIPVGDSFDSSRYINAAQDLIIAKVGVGVGGTSEYRVIVTSYDSAGANPTIHINSLQAFAVDNSITTLSFLDDSILAERTLVLTITEETIGTACEDFSLTLVSSLFGDLDQITGGHTVEDDAAAQFTQRQNLQFHGAEVSDDAGNDRTIVTVNPIGGILRADITVGQFQTQMGLGWIEANGQSSVGTAYETLTTNTVVPSITDGDGLTVMIRVD